MAPSRQKAVLRLLAAILFFSSIVFAATLPHLQHTHRLLDPRDIHAGDGIPVVLNSEPKQSWFKQVGDSVRKLATDVKDFLDGLLWREPTEGTVTTVYVTPTPSPGASSSEGVAGPSSATSSFVSLIATTTPASSVLESTASKTLVEVSSLASGTVSATGASVSASTVETSSSASEATFFTIWPWSSETTASSALSVSETVPSTETAVTASISASSEASATGVVISDTDIISTPTPPVELPSNTTSKPLVLTNPIRPTGWPESNISLPVTTIQINTTTKIKITSTVLVTLTASPIPATGTAGASNGTSLLPVVTESPLYPNTTFSSIPLVTGTAPVASNSTAPAVTETPLYPNTTFASIPLVTGTAPAGPNATVSETPLYPNTTFSSIPPTTDTAPVISNGTGLTVPTAPPFNPNTTIPGTETGTSAASDNPTIQPPTTPPPYPNTTFPNTFPPLPPPSPTLSLSLPLFPLPTSSFPISLPTPTSLPPLLSRFCTSSPSPQTLSLPLLSSLFTSKNHPSLTPFLGGCSAPKSPDSPLLDCTALGTAIQACQHNGKRVVLSVRASGVGDVGGDSQYGVPGRGLEPFGPAFYGPGFGDGAGDGGEEVDGDGYGGRRSRLSLFDERNTPEGLAGTLYSLFGEEGVERGGLRPLGEGVVVDGFHIEVPVEWKGTWQGEQFRELEKRLSGLFGESWKESGEKKGGPGDVGAVGKGRVTFEWTTEERKE